MWGPWRGFCLTTVTAIFLRSALPCCTCVSVCPCRPWVYGVFHCHGISMMSVCLYCNGSFDVALTDQEDAGRPGLKAMSGRDVPSLLFISSQQKKREKAGCRLKSLPYLNYTRRLGQTPIEQSAPLGSSLTVSSLVSPSYHTQSQFISLPLQ